MKGKPNLFNECFQRRFLWPHTAGTSRVYFEMDRTQSSAFITSKKNVDSNHDKVKFVVFSFPK